MREPAAPGIDGNLPAQLFHNTLELAQPRSQLNLSLARTLWRRIGVLVGFLPARGATGGGEDARSLGTSAVGAGHLLVAADSATTAGDAGARIEGSSRATR